MAILTNEYMDSLAYDELRSAAAGRLEEAQVLHNAERDADKLTAFALIALIVLLVAAIGVNAGSAPGFAVILVAGLAFASIKTAAKFMEMYGTKTASK